MSSDRDRPAASAMTDGPTATEPLLLPIGHYVGALHRDGQPGARPQVRRGASFHELSDDQFAVWSAAHGAPEAIEDEVAWQRRSVAEHPQVAGVADVDLVVDELLQIGLLTEVSPDAEQALAFARSHRLVPLMLGLGNSTEEPDLFDIGFLHQPAVSTTHPIYDLWQWSTMEDSVWATCESAADVAQRSGFTNPDHTDPARLLVGLLGALHALLLSRAAYLDIGFSLNWPEDAPAAAEISAQVREPAAFSRRADPLILPVGHYLGAHLPEPGAAADFHVVRIGWETYKLAGDEELAVWALAHGLPTNSSDEPSPWTRSSIEGAAGIGGIPDVGSTLFDLISRDLLIEVMPGTQEAVEFAQVCRTRSLLVGLGNTADDPTRYALGISDSTPPVVEVPTIGYELWAWGHACESLWHACCVLAAAGDQADPDQADPQRVLTRCLPAIQLLVASGAMYLDEARDDFAEDRVAGTG